MWAEAPVQGAMFQMTGTARWLIQVLVLYKHQVPPCPLRTLSGLLIMIVVLKHLRLLNEMEQVPGIVRAINGIAKRWMMVHLSLLEQILL